MTRPGSRSGWTLRPASQEVRTAFTCAGLLFVLFVAVYGGSNWLTAQCGDPYRLYFDWELSLPFVPAMVWVYLSLLATFVLPMFCLRQHDLILLSRRLAWGLMLAGACFLLLPARLGFGRPEAVPEWDAVFRVIYALDFPHNLVPSLHIVWSAVILWTLRAASPPWTQRLFELWFALICVSVVLVHQHHLVDVFGGMLAVVAVVRAVGPAGRGIDPGKRKSGQAQGRTSWARHG